MIQMSNLFSTFDPQSFWHLPLCWLSCVGVLAFIPAPFWAGANPMSSSLKSVLKTLDSEFTVIFGAKSSPALTGATIVVFLTVVTNNVLGLLPYVFTATSHLTLTLSLALPLWLGHMLISWKKTPNSMLAHLVPLGTPLPLMPFMVAIELISNIIRPLTLSVRLAANMMAGHLLLTLLTTNSPLSSSPVLLLILCSTVLLASLESAVALIQAYVFSVLSTLYLNEVNSPSLSF